MTVDLCIDHEEIKIANTRKILFADGLWVGNLISESVEISPEHQEILINVGKYARHHGYVVLRDVIVEWIFLLEKMVKYLLRK